MEPGIVRLCLQQTVGLGQGIGYFAAAVEGNGVAIACGNCGAGIVHRTLRIQIAIEFGLHARVLFNPGGRHAAFAALGVIGVF